MIDGQSTVPAISSFLRVWPFLSHNRSRQLCTLLLKLDTKCFVMEKRADFVSSNNCKFFSSLNLVSFMKSEIVYNTVQYMCVPWTHHCTGEAAGHGNGPILVKDDSCERHWPSTMNYLSMVYIETSQQTCTNKDPIKDKLNCSALLLQSALGNIQG